jgi:putative hemolysin
VRHITTIAAIALGLAVATPTPPAVAMQTAPGAYCTQTAGSVYSSGGHDFCAYLSAHDGSRIVIALRTLYDEKPSLAALLYVLKPSPVGHCHGNPSSCYCAQLGGTGTAVTIAGQDIEMCFFADGSAIDAWGLTYHANGVVRGVDLTRVMRFKYDGR